MKEIIQQKKDSVANQKNEPNKLDESRVTDWIAAVKKELAENEKPPELPKDGVNNSEKHYA